MSAVTVVGEKPMLATPSLSSDEVNDLTDELGHDDSKEAKAM
jgi:hypothetical protein